MKTEIIVLLLSGAILIGLTAAVTHGVKEEATQDKDRAVSGAVFQNKHIFSQFRAIENYKQEVEAQEWEADRRRRFGIPDPIEVRIVK